MSNTDNLKKLIKTIIIDKYENIKDLEDIKETKLYEITDIRKIDINDEEYIKFDKTHFYNRMELDQTIYRLCKVFNLKTYIIRDKYFNDKVIYIIDNLFIYNTKFPLSERQIKNLIIEFNNNDIEEKHGKLDNFLFLKKYHQKNNIPFIKYIDINEIKNN